MRGLGVLVAVVVVALVAGLFFNGNPEPVTVNLLFSTRPDVPLWRALLGSFITGGLAVAGVASWPYLRLRLRVRTQARQITRLEQEVHGLRTLPLPDEEQSVREG
ncbi:MAG: LapA family protein [Myxococcota bacterium]